MFRCTNVFYVLFETKMKPLPSTTQLPRWKKNNKVSHIWFILNLPVRKSFYNENNREIHWREVRCFWAYCALCISLICWFNISEKVVKWVYISTCRFIKYQYWNHSNYFILHLLKRKCLSSFRSSKVIIKYKIFKFNEKQFSITQSKEVV